MVVRKIANGSARTFPGNHALVLPCTAKEPEVRRRGVARRVGITDRPVQRIVAEFEAAA